MNEWTERQLCAFPAAFLPDANALAAIIDPDTGGAFTFSAEQTRGDYIVAAIPFKTDFWPIVERRDPAEWKSVMREVAVAFRRDPLSDELIETLCSTMLINDEVRNELNHD